MKIIRREFKPNRWIIGSGIILFVAVGLYLWADYFFSVSVYPSFTMGYSLFWTIIGLLWLWPQSLRFKFLVLFLFLGLILSIRFIPWNSRKPFLTDLYRVEAGMTEAQVGQVMGKYIRGTGWPANPIPAADEPGELTLAGAEVYRHTDDGWGNSDWGVVNYIDGRVVSVEFLPD